MRPDWIAVDWGTTHCRAWAMGADGTMLAEAQSAEGMGQLAPAAPEAYEAALLRLIGPWLGQAPVSIVACGMIGARQGWIEAPYMPVPCAPVGGGAIRPTTRDPRLALRILPGLSQSAPADVMRGEETQIAGALALRPGFDGVIVLPGTHSKWAHVSAGEVVSFRSFLTGELFALLSGQSVLRHSTGEGWQADAFAAAVEDSLSRPAALASRLFSIRAEDLLHGLAPGVGRARLSGLLIGMELAAAKPYWLGQPVTILGADRLADAYATALAAQGVHVARIDATEATCAGLAAAHALLKETA
ncbi:MAG: 2-dehydro-3-deoxygalactonokinase [Proteobacteria bacterium]|nr:2-dehydro-3-deoxygalactonokinase [Pseudomonadota bacterium]